MSDEYLEEKAMILPFKVSPCGLYYKDITIVNDGFSVVSK